MSDQQVRSYNSLCESTKAVLDEFRDEVYEVHGMINPSFNVLTNLFYHMMYELTLATNKLEGWEESEEFVKTHNQVIELLEYQRPS